MTVELGAVVSTSHVNVAGEASVFPATSVARTLKVWLPSARGPGYARGLAQPPQRPASSLHSKAEPGSSAVNAKLAAVALVGSAGCESIVVAGASVSTVKVLLEAASTLPAASTARTRTV